MDEIIYEPYTYDEMIDRMEDGKVEALVEVDRRFYDELEAAERNEWEGYAGDAQDLYDELAEKVIGNQFCYYGLLWEPTTVEPLDARENMVLSVTVEPDLSE